MIERADRLEKGPAAAQDRKARTSNMAGTFKFELVSPERILMSVDAEQVVMPGAEGDFTVLADHAPVISTLRPGVLDVTLENGRKRVFVKGGFAEVEGDRATVLAPTALDLDEVSASRIAEEIRIAEAELAEAKDDEERFNAERAISEMQALQVGA
jgi:F-type H+-transporting ATPase subunit epsilon